MTLFEQAGTRLTLIADLLRAGNPVRIKVQGMSMLPSIWPGDIVTVDPCNSASPGEIILYEADNRFFIHRLVRQFQLHERIEWITRGDAMDAHDQISTECHLLGRVSEIYRNGRLHTPPVGLTPLMRAIGWILCKSASLRNLALRLHSLRQPRDHERISAAII